VKALVAEVLKERSLQQQDIFHRIDMLDGKNLAICKATFGIEIVVSQVLDENDVVDHKEGSLG
jgi:hypothetical protein